MDSQDIASEIPFYHAAWSAYKIPILLAFGSIGFTAVSIVLLVKSAQTSIPIQFSSESELVSTGSATRGIWVDVSGAVVVSGVYELALGDRIEEALIAAGGLHRDADDVWIAKNINRAMKVTDGAKVYIPFKGETSHNIDVAQSTSQVAGMQTAVVSKVSINMASVSELETLTGVGPVTAQKIIDNRPYTSVNQLLEKKVIGPSVYDKIKNNLSL